ncbi:hypothetical protein, partial [Lacinutrix salivirga]
MSNTFEFAERLGYTPAFQFTEQSQNSGFYKEHVNFENLVKTLKKNKPNLFSDFHYINYISTQKSRVEVKDRETEELFIAEYITDVPF